MSIVLLDNNADLYKATGVDRFHEAGYFGERVNAASGEIWNLNEYNPDNLCSSPTGVNGTGDHGRETASVFFQVAPKAHLYMFESDGKYGSTKKYNGKTYTTKIMDDIFPNIDKLNITAMFTSLLIYGNNEFREDYSNEMNKHPNLCSCFAAGNDGEKSYNRMMKVNEIFGIGGFVLNGKDKTPKLSGESSYYKNENYVDFCAPWNAYSYYVSPSSPGSFAGTSIATPWFCGMICLINDFFIDKTGKPLNREKMRQFLIDCCVDIEEDGEDCKSGWGIPVLPYPDSIDISKYVDNYEEDEDKDEDNVNPPEEIEKPESNYIVYTVKAGDTLYRLAKTYLGDGNRYKEIMELNGLTSTTIYKNQSLKISYNSQEKDDIDIFIENNNLDFSIKPYIEIFVESSIIKDLNNYNLSSNITLKEQLNNMISLVDFLK